MSNIQLLFTDTPNISSGNIIYSKYFSTKYQKRQNNNILVIKDDTVISVEKILGTYVSFINDTFNKIIEERNLPCKKSTTYLKTFHGGILCYNIEINSLVWNENSSIPILIPVEINFSNQKIYLSIFNSEKKYITTIDKSGLISLSNSQKSFDYVKHDNDCISLLVENKYLSAQRKGKIVTVNECKDWEYFSPI